MKEKWLFPNAVVPVDVETTASLVAEIHRLIGVVGNTALAQASQEPVAWQFMNGSNFRKRRPDDFADLDSDGLPYWKPLYTYPPQRTWVDLTPKDLNEIFAVAMSGEGAVNRAAAKLKEKNT